MSSHGWTRSLCISMDMTRHFMFQVLWRVICASMNVIHHDPVFIFPQTRLVFVYFHGFDPLCIYLHLLRNGTGYRRFLSDTTLQTLNPRTITTPTSLFRRAGSKNQYTGNVSVL
jgi:hypothetical protein